MFTDSQSQTRLKQLSMHAGTAKIRQDRPVVGVLIPHCAPANYSKQDETNTYICDKKVLLLYYPIGRRKLCLRTAHCSSPANEKSLYFGCPASSNGLLGYHSPSQLHPFPYRSKNPFLVLWICLWSTIVYTSGVAIPLLFPNKINFAGQILVYHITKLTKQIDLPAESVTFAE